VFPEPLHKGVFCEVFHILSNRFGGQCRPLNSDGFVKSPSAALRLSASRLRSKALSCLLWFAAFGRKPKPPASQVAVYASFVIATYDKYASFLNIAPDGLRRGARLASGAFYCAVCLLTFYKSINSDCFVKSPSVSRLVGITVRCVCGFFTNPSTLIRDTFPNYLLDTRLEW
jgi:hypothetical protein